MTDLEMIKKCAEKMGYDKYGWQTGGIVTGSDLPILMPTGRITYDPLHNDAQAMALVKKLRLMIWTETAYWLVADSECEDRFRAINKDLNRAIVECVSKLV